MRRTYDIVMTVMKPVSRFTKQFLCVLLLIYSMHLAIFTPHLIHEYLERNMKSIAGKNTFLGR